MIKYDFGPIILGKF